MVVLFTAVYVYIYYTNILNIYTHTAYSQTDVQKAMFMLVYIFFFFTYNIHSNSYIHTLRYILPHIDIHTYIHINSLT